MPLAYLVFIQLAVFIFLFTLILEGDDNKTYEDVHHEEGNDNNVDEEEDGHGLPMVVDRADIFCVRVYRLVHETGSKVKEPG